MSKFFQGYIEKKQQTNSPRQAKIASFRGKGFWKILSQYLFYRMRLSTFLLNWIGYASLLSHQVKSLMIQNLYWGRSKLFKTSSHIIVAFLTIFLGISNLTTEIAKVNANTQRYTVDPIISSDYIKSSGSINDLNVTDQVFSSIIPQAKVVVQNGDTLDSVAKKFVTEDVKFAKDNFGLDLEITQDMIDNKKGVIVYLNSLKNDKDIKVGQELTAFTFDGTIHVAKTGDTLDTIAEKYKATREDIEQVNLITYDNLDVLKEGQAIIVPNAKLEVPKAPPPPVVVTKPAVVSTAPSGAGNVSYVPNGQFIIPMNAASSPTVTCGWYCYNPHPALDIACTRGYNDGLCYTLAAADGVVIVASSGGWNGGYGNYIVIDHGNGYQTLYAHHQKLYVNVGDTVKQGQAIGYEGATGRVTGAHLHFEVKLNGTNLNPRNFLNI